MSHAAERNYRCQDIDCRSAKSDITIPRKIVGEDQDDRLHNAARLDQDDTRLPNALRQVLLECLIPTSTMEMEDLVHDLPLAVQLQQREHVREA